MKQWIETGVAHGITLGAALIVGVGLAAVGSALAEDKTPPPSITLDNCAKVATEVQKAERPNGTVWLQSVTCIGDAVAPEIRKPSIMSSSGSCCVSCCVLVKP